MEGASAAQEAFLAAARKMRKHMLDGRGWE